MYASPPDTPHPLPADGASPAAPRCQPPRLAPPGRVLVVQGLPDFIALVERHAQRCRRQGLGLAVLRLVAEPDPGTDGADGPAAHDPLPHLLADCGHRLASRVRATDLVLRHGAHEFGVLLPGAGDAAAWAVSLRLLRAGSGVYRVGQHLLGLRLRTGHAVCPGTAEDGATLVHAAGATTAALPPPASGLAGWPAASLT